MSNVIGGDGYGSHEDCNPDDALADLSGATGDDCWICGGPLDVDTKQPPPLSRLAESDRIVNDLEGTGHDAQCGCHPPEDVMAWLRETYKPEGVAVWLNHWQRADEAKRAKMLRVSRMDMTGDDGVVKDGCRPPHYWPEVTDGT